MARALFALSMFLLLVIAQTVSAENDLNSKEKEPEKPHLKKYLTDKYTNIHDVSSTLVQMPHGPKGWLSISGKIIPKAVAEKKLQAGEGEHGKAKAIARAFMEEEAELLGITNMSEIRENRISRNEGDRGFFTRLYFHRYVGKLQMEHAYIEVTIGPDDTTITGVSAELVPSPPELYAAVSKPTLTQEKIFEIIKWDLKSLGKDQQGVTVLGVKKVAIPTNPYVIWVVDVGLTRGLGRWEYRLDAFTGEIIKKQSTLIPFMPPRK